MTTSGSGNHPSQKRFSGVTLRRTLDQVSGCWFPPNEKLLRKIQTGLQSGVYDNDFDLLVGEITKDFSLFSYCLRELAEMAREAGAEEAPAGPVTLLRRAGLQKLRGLLEVEPKSICPDSLNAISELQLTRFQEFMISVSASSALSDHYSINPELALGAALVRQLGYTLIAWAYPSEYERAFAQSSNAVSLDQLLTQTFGFSPTLLGFKIAKRWNLLPEIYRATDTGGDAVIYGSREAEEIEKIAETLVHISRVGEALARANNPGRYPSAVVDFDFARVEIEKALGPSGIDTIREKLAEHCQAYVDLMPHIFRGAFELEPLARINQHQKMGDEREVLGQCRPFLRKKLEHLYHIIKPGTPSKDAVQLLARDIIPSAGFIRGVVYILEPGSMALVPQLAIANCSVSEFSAVEYAPQSSRGSFIAEALQAAVPLSRVFPGSAGGRIVAISGGLGESSRMGVLYLEMGAELFEGDEAQQLAHFRAIVRFLNCCLGNF